MDVTVYTQPHCPQCTATKRKLAAAGIPYTEIDVTKDDEARAQILTLGFRSAPVVRADDDWWTGFRPDRIKALTQAAVAA